MAESNERSRRHQSWIHYKLQVLHVKIAEGQDRSRVRRSLLGKPTPHAKRRRKDPRQSHKQHPDVKTKFMATTPIRSKIAPLILLRPVPSSIGVQIVRFFVPWVAPLAVLLFPSTCVLSHLGCAAIDSRGNGDTASTQTNKTQGLRDELQAPRRHREMKAQRQSGKERQDSSADSFTRRNSCRHTQSAGVTRRTVSLTSNHRREPIQQRVQQPIRSPERLLRCPRR